MKLIRSILAIGICLTSAARAVEELTLEDFSPSALPGSAFEFEEDEPSPAPTGRWKAVFSATTVTIIDFPGFPGTFKTGWLALKKNPQDIIVPTVGYSYELAASPAFGGKAAALRLWVSDTDPRFLVTVDGVSSYGDVEPSIAKPAPVIKVVVAGKPLNNGKSTVKFAAVKVGNTSASRKITIENTGSATLDISSIQKRGLDRTEFVISKLGKTSIPTGKRASFNIRFKPKDIGNRRATLLIFSNDEDESPFTIRLSGSGRQRAPESE